MLDLSTLLLEAHIQHGPPNPRGWINDLPCPFCGKNHLGWNINHGRFFCWACLGHPTLLTLSRLLGITQTKARELLAKAGQQPAKPLSSAVQGHSRGRFTLPPGTGEGRDPHKAYLIRRGFDPGQVLREWGFLATGPDTQPIFANRIIAPLTLRGEMVSWQGRSIHPNCPPDRRYRTAPPEWESVFHKNTVYGLDQVVGDSVLVVEGMMDVWKMGPGAVHTFGVSWTRGQLAALMTFRRVVVGYDNEPDAQVCGTWLAEELASLGVDAAVVCPDSGKDWGDLPITQARVILQEIL